MSQSDPSTLSSCVTIAPAVGATSMATNCSSFPVRNRGGKYEGSATRWTPKSWPDHCHLYVDGGGAERMTMQAPVPMRLNYGVCAHAMVASFWFASPCYPTESLLREWMKSLE